jgi:hypothetical protein
MMGVPVVCMLGRKHLYEGELSERAQAIWDVYEELLQG